MEPTTMNGIDGLSGLLIAGIVLFLILAPPIIAITRSAGVLTFYAFAFCLLSLGGIFIAALLLPLFTPVMVAPFFVLMWLAALACGLAARAQKAQNQRSEELTFRLLYNDLDRLSPPDSLRKKYEAKEPEFRPGFGPASG
jgi:uncharacterized membrane protein